MAFILVLAAQHRTDGHCPGCAQLPRIPCAITVEQAADGLVVVRYLDDILLGAETDQLLGEARERVQDGLRRYGMSLKEAKTGEYLLESDGDAFTFLGTRFERTSLENGHAYRTLPAPRRTSRHK